MLLRGITVDTPNDHAPLGNAVDPNKDKAAANLKALRYRLGLCLWTMMRLPGSRLPTVGDCCQILSVSAT
jgi:hypothetical protein